MRHRLIIAGLAFAALCAPAFAQGQGGYSNDAPGAATTAMPNSSVQHMRKHHMTNDTSGGASSVDKSGKTQEGGGTTAGAQGDNQAMGTHAPGNSGGAMTRPNGQ